MKTFTSQYGFGDELRDKTSGVTGIVVGVTAWVTGCTRYNIQPPAGKDNKLPELVGVDEISAQLVKAGKVDLTPKRKDGPPSSVTQRPRY